MISDSSEKVFTGTTLDPTISAMTPSRNIFSCLAILLSVAITFAAGWGLAYVKYHYTYDVIDEKSFDFPPGSKIHVRHAFEGVGFQFLTPETSVVEWEESPGDKVVLYKARRGFQEASRHVEKIEINSHDLQWDDGRSRYRLTIEPLPRSPPSPAKADTSK